MLAFTEDTIPKISPSLDWFNVMTYDMMNRRDNVTKHHAGVMLSLEAIDAYESHGVPSENMNLGFAFYIRWYRTDPSANCNRNPIGCRTVLMEDPLTGDDLGHAGAFSWHDPVPKRLQRSYRRAMSQGHYDEEGGGHFFWDSEENLWWSWETPESIAKKFQVVVQGRKLRGVFPWALGEDAPSFAHLDALNECVKWRMDDTDMLTNADSKPAGVDFMPVVEL